MHIIRSTLTPYFHPKRKVYILKGAYPIRKEDGTIERKRGYVGSACDTRALCQTECDRLNKHYEDLAIAGPLEPTLEEAVATYLGAGGDRRFLGEVEGGPSNKLLDILGKHRVNDINDQLMIKAVAALYPTAAPATTPTLYPVIAVHAPRERDR